ncbi:MAG: response regulator [Phycisphaerae bacterium]|nr:response regulator [Phycisphaerae bacterium]
MYKTIHKIFFVDDEPMVRKAVDIILSREGYRVTTFSSPQNCINSLKSKKCHLLITDVNMPDMNGIDLLTQAKSIAPLLPVLVVTGYADIPLAVRAVKAGADNFIEKPLDKDTLLPLVYSLIKKYTSRYLKKRLTKMERTVLKLLLDGKGNRSIAIELQRSIRTIEDHRFNLMKKFGTDNVVDLVKKALNMDLSDLD